MVDLWLTQKVHVMKKLAWIALAGIVLLVPTIWLDFKWLGAVVAVLVVPAVVYFMLLPKWHWKSRCIGKHSDLWGALWLLETTGWFKIVYWIRHIGPDLRKASRSQLLRIDEEID